MNSNEYTEERFEEIQKELDQSLQAITIYRKMLKDFDFLKSKVAELEKANKILEDTLQKRESIELLLERLSRQADLIDKLPGIVDRIERRLDQ